MADSKPKAISLVFTTNAKLVAVDGAPQGPGRRVSDALLQPLFSGDVIGIGGAPVLKPEELGLPDVACQVRLGLDDIEGEAALANGDAILELIQAAVVAYERVGDGTDRATARAELTLLHHLFRDVFLRSPEVHTLLSKLWSEETETVQRILGTARDRPGRPGKLHRDTAIVRTMDRLKDELGLSTLDAAKRLREVRAAADLPGVRRLLNQYSRLHEVVSRFCRPRWVRADQLEPHPWRPPGAEPEPWTGYLVVHD